MDIQRWLNDTGGQNATIDEHLAGTSRRTEPIKVLPSQRKRRREASDTSLLESEPGNAISAKRRRERSATTSSGSSTAMSSHSSDSEALSERYEKRLRHKTRDGLYEPNSGVRREQSKRRKSKNKKGKSKHRKTKKKFYRRELAGRSLVDNFNARNVRRFRLTLNSATSVGVFQKGKASYAVQGAHGLPDLVFSEMRFLHKPSHSIDDVPQSGEGKVTTMHNKRRERSHEQNEISQFFCATENAPPLSRSDAARSEGQEGLRQRTPSTNDRRTILSEQSKEAQGTIEISPTKALTKVSHEMNAEMDKSRSTSRFVHCSTAVDIGQLTQLYVPKAGNTARNQPVSCVAAASIGNKKTTGHPAQDIVNPILKEVRDRKDTSATFHQKQVAPVACEERGVFEQSHSLAAQIPRVESAAETTSSLSLLELLRACDSATEDREQGSMEAMKSSNAGSDQPLPFDMCAKSACENTNTRGKPGRLDFEQPEHNTYHASKVSNEAGEKSWKSQDTAEHSFPHLGQFAPQHFQRLGYSDFVKTDRPNDDYENYDEVNKGYLNGYYETANNWRNEDVVPRERVVDDEYEEDAVIPADF